MIHRTKCKTLCLLFALFSVFGNFCYSASASNEPCAMLDTGANVNAKMKSLASGENTNARTATGDIRAIHMAESLPDGFVPSEANTVSTTDSGTPIYIFFDNEDGAGIIYFYTENNTPVMNPDSSYMFFNNTALTDISGLASWDSSGVVSLQGAFMMDSSLSNITPLSDWKTDSLVYMGTLFSNDTALADITALASWNTSNVMDMHAIFGGARSLSDALALRNWDTSSVTDMSLMFSGCTSMLFADVSGWNTSKVTTMASMFQVGDSWKGNGQLIEILGLGNLDVSNVTDMTCMFYGAGQMTTYNIDHWDVSKVESMNHMFCDNSKLRSLDLSNWDVSSLKTIHCMFDDDMNLKSIGDVSHWNTINLVDAGGWLNNAGLFIGDNNGVFDLSGWDTSNLKAAGEMFYSTSIHTIDLSGWTFDSITNDLWDGAGRGIYYTTGNDSENLRGLGAMFQYNYFLTTVYVSQSGLDSYNAAVERGVNTQDMWSKSKKVNGFTVK